MSNDVTPTHVKINYGRDGRATMALPNRWNPGDPFDGSSRFAHLDGRRSWSEVWALLPTSFDGDHRLPGIDLDEWPEEYIQTAGRRGRLTVEIRKFDAGSFRQFVVGRPPAKGFDFGTDLPAELIEWGEFSVKVYPHEVWTSATATPVFRYWFSHGILPSHLVLRELHL